MHNHDIFGQPEILAAPLAPLIQPKSWVLDETINDVGSSTWEYMWNKQRTRTIVIGCIALTWLILGFLVGILNGLSEGGLALIIVPPLILCGIYVGVINNKIRHEFYEQFAKANNMTYQQNGTLALTGALFDLGHSQKTEDIIS